MRSPKMHLVRKCVNLRKRTVPLEFLIQESRGVKKKKRVDPLWVQACSSVDLESVFPTHGVVGSNPTKPKYFDVNYSFLKLIFTKKKYK